MQIPAWAALNAYTLLLIIMLLAMSFSQGTRGAGVRQTRTFIRLLMIVLCLLVMDSVGRAFNGRRESTAFFLTRLGNWFIFACDPFGYVFSLDYISCWIDESKRSLKYWRILMYAYGIINFVMVTISAIFRLGWFYSYTDHIYMRGPLYIPRAIVNTVFCILVEIFVLTNEGSINRRYRFAISVYPLIVALFGAGQATFGIQLEYSGTVFACLLLYVYVQARDLNEDYLTGAFNRRKAEEAFEKCFAAGKKFSAVMIDVDFFKNINDQFGHAEGDLALQDVYGILKRSFRRDDIIGRYGGDEFCVVSATDNAEVLGQYIVKLRQMLDLFNETHKRDYKLSLSLGYGVFDPEEYESAGMIMREIDRRMYADKAEHHGSSRNCQPENRI